MFSFRLFLIRFLYFIINCFYLQVAGFYYIINTSQRETCEAFGISEHALKTWRRQLKNTGTLENAPKIRRWRNPGEPGDLLLDIHRNPDDFNEERAKKFGCTGEAIRRAMKKLKYPG